MFVGGFLSNTIDIKMVYTILLAFPALLIIWASFVFKEIPVSLFR